MRAFLRAGLVGLALLLAVPAAGQDMKKGVEAAKRGDYATALREWRPLAEAGDAFAQTFLGAMYLNGEGVPQDYAAALKWYRLAAEQGLAIAQDHLGAIYYKGLGVPQDYAAAHMWSNLAAAQGNANAAKNRDLAASKMTPADISKAQRLAKEWREKHPQ
jgi:uncharacterized protein